MPHVYDGNYYTKTNNKKDMKKVESKDPLFWYGTGKVLLILALAFIIALPMNSCTSQSVKTIHKYEKCVVMDSSYPVYYMLEYTEGYKYRVKRIEHQNTTLTLYNPNIWHVGDTVILGFQSLPYE